MVNARLIRWHRRRRIDRYSFRSAELIHAYTRTMFGVHSITAARGRVKRSSAVCLLQTCIRIASAATTKKKSALSTSIATFVDWPHRAVGGGSGTWLALRWFAGCTACCFGFQCGRARRLWTYRIWSGGRMRSGRRLRFGGRCRRFCFGRCSAFSVSACLSGTIAKLRLASLAV